MMDKIEIPDDQVVPWRSCRSSNRISCAGTLAGPAITAALRSLATRFEQVALPDNEPR